MIKKLMLLGSGLLSLNLFGAQAVERRIENNDLFASLDRCKPVFIERISHLEAALTGREVDRLILQKTFRKLNEIDRIQWFAIHNQNDTLLRKSVKRERELYSLLDDMRTENDTSLQNKRRKIEHNAKNTTRES